MNSPSLAHRAPALSHRRAHPPQLRLVICASILLAAGVVMGHPSLDIPAFFALQSITRGVSPAFWSAWSVLGLGLCTALVAALVADERMAPVTSMLWALLLGGLALQAFKHIWVLPRPLAVLPDGTVDMIGLHLRAGAMPSGHAAMLVALACVLAREFWRRWPALALVCLLLGAVGSIGRVAVGVHWPSDILVGASVGVFSVVAGDAVESRWSLGRWLSTPLGRRLFALIQLGAAIVLLAMHTGYPLAVPVQWLLGLASIASAIWRWHGARSRPAAVEVAP